MQISFNSTINFKYDLYKNKIKRITDKTFKKLKIKNNFLIELNFINNVQIKNLNTKYRKISKETDVLSFAFLELKKNEVKIQSKVLQILGEIDISIEKTKSQAKEFNHSFEFELIYLYVHGLLHLLGFDHTKSEYSAKKMFKLQDEILKSERII